MEIPQFFPRIFVQKNLNQLQKTFDEITVVIAWAFPRLNFLIGIDEFHGKAMENLRIDALF